jgi:hypothetical protein
MNDVDKSVDLLLIVLQKDSSLEPLIRRGYEYHQIIQLIELAKGTGLVESDDVGTRLTPRGTDRLLNLKRKGMPAGPDAWIAPINSAVIEKTDPWEIYLPAKKWRDE